VLEFEVVLEGEFAEGADFAALVDEVVAQAGFGEGEVGCGRALVPLLPRFGVFAFRIDIRFHTLLFINNPLTFSYRL
jgi:hypothetical protein